MKTIELKVKPSARRSRLTEQPDGTWIAEVRAPPVDGKANDEVILLVAEQFDVPRSRVAIRTGIAARTKRVRIDV